LKKYDERGLTDLVTDQLSLHKSLDRTLSELSGGELQRLAVAIAVNKDADYYFFDEPSSYNDIYQ
jgi:ATP-binding cassette subfamily E protein 1